VKSTLPYVRQVLHLSPSALRSLEDEPVRFYLERLGPEETKPLREPQGYPAAVGTAFDALVKRAAAEALGLPCPSLEDMLANVETERERAVAQGSDLLADYRLCGAFELFLAQGPTHLDLVLNGTLPDAVDPIPLVGIADAVLSDEVHDWKVKGANRPGEDSPTPGYELFLGFDGTRKGPHERHGQPLELIDPAWAAQIVTYWWLLNLPGPVQASIDEIVCGRGVARFRATISPNFQAALRERYRKAWSRIQEEKVVDERTASVGADSLWAFKEFRRWG